jgi:hypothetical protein
VVMKESAFGHEQSFVQVHIPHLYARLPCPDHNLWRFRRSAGSRELIQYDRYSTYRYRATWKHRGVDQTLVLQQRPLVHVEHAPKTHWYIMSSLCVCPTHTHPDADILKAVFDTTRFQHIWSPSYRSFDLLSSLNEQERILAAANTSFDPIRNSHLVCTICP